MDIYILLRASQAPGVDDKRYTDSLKLATLSNGNMVRISVKATDTLETIKVSEKVLNMFQKNEQQHVVYVGTNVNTKPADPTASFESLGLKQGSTLEVYVSIR